jgi:hypothetical protein
MKIAKTSNTIPTLKPADKAPEATVKVTKAGAAIDAGLRNYLSQNLAGLPLGGPLGSVGANTRPSFGAPVTVSPGAELLPLFGVNIFDANAANEQISAISEVLSAPP